MTESPFAGRSIPDPGFAGDDGSPDADVVRALDAFASGAASGREVMAALQQARLFVPVVALLDEVGTDPHGRQVEKQSSMATMLVDSPTGSRALVAFTSAPRLAAWRDDARPVPVAAARAAQAALSEGADTLLLDLAGPVPFALTGQELRTLAFARVALPAHEDPDVLAAVVAAVEPEAAVVGAHVGAAGGGLRIVLVVVPSIGAEAFRALVPRVTGRLGSDLTLRSRVTGGLQVTVVPPGREPDDTPRIYWRT